MRIETKRLILRVPEMKDAKDIRENINNLNVTKWLLVVPYPYSLKDAKDYIKKAKDKLKKRIKEGYNFSIELKSEKKVIGGIGMHHVNNFSKTAEVGYWLGEKYWKNGYGSEALSTLLKLAFNKLKLRRVYADVFSGNPASGKLLEKFGFKNEGLARKAHKSKASGKIMDTLKYGLLKEEWKR